MFHKVYHRRHITLLVHIPEIYSRSFRSELFCEKGVLKNFTNFWEKNLCSNIFFDKVPALRPGTYLKKGLLHRGFPVSLKQIFRTASFIEQLYWLLLFFWYLQISEETNKRCSTKKFLSVCSYMSCTVWLNGWVFVYELSGYCFKSGCSHLKSSSLNRWKWLKNACAHILVKLHDIGEIQKQSPRGVLKKRETLVPGVFLWIFRWLLLERKLLLQTVF